LPHRRPETLCFQGAEVPVKQPSDAYPCREFSTGTRGPFFAKKKFLLTRKLVNDEIPLMLDVEVIADPAAATVALDPVRSRLLAELAEPASAATLAGRLGVARQKINYHLRTLEEHRLVEVAEKRKWGGLTERLLVATAASYVVSPGAMGPVATDPGRTADRLSAGYLIALAARVVREVSDLLARARKAGKRLATFSLDTEIRFRSAEERAEFSHELTAMVASLVARYHDASAPGGRRHRLVIVAHPLPQTTSGSEQESGRGCDLSGFSAAAVSG
jgi:DNA-binding transcriptional ArsR family regulator